MPFNTMKLFVVLALNAIALMASPSRAFAQSGPIELDDTAPVVTRPASTSTPRPGTPVGRRAAEKYMGSHEAAVGTNTDADVRSQSRDDHYLALHAGAFISDNAYSWGSHDAQSNVGKLTAGLTYRIGEWQHTMDLAARFDYSSYSLDDGSASKISLLPLITFPDAASRFPLYLGAGVGLGIFTKQINRESALSFDYQVVLGARFFDVFGATGFFIEAGLKNHILLLSDGQFNGTFVAVGPVFTF